MPEFNNNEQRARSVPYFMPNEPIGADDLNRVVMKASAGCKGMNSPRQALLMPSVGVYQILIFGIQGDYLQGNYWDGTTQGDEDIMIAKPFLLQQSTLDGQTINGISYAFTGIDQLTATRASDSTTENWQVTMSYSIGDIIYAIGNVRGGLDTIEDLQFIDLNIDGRAWAKV